MGAGRLRAWVARHRRALIAATLLVLLAVRVALPVVARRQLEAQANALVAARTRIGDVDLRLLRGGVALEAVTVHAEHAAADTAPLLAFDRFYVQIGYLPLLFRTLRLEAIELDGLAVAVDRLEDGTVPLPGLRPTAEEAPPPEPEGEPGDPWRVVVARAALRRGTLTLEDRAARPPTTVSLGLPALDVTGFELQYGPEARPGQGVITARFGEGRMRLKTSVAAQRSGWAYGARLDVDDLPLDQMHVHVPQLRWSALRGRLDAGLTLSAPPRALPAVRGTVAIRDLQIDVPEETEPALAWKRLEVDVERLDPGARVVRVARVTLDAGGVIVEPRAPVALPILPAPDGAPPPAEEPAPGAPAEPWRWSVGAVEVRDSMAKVVLEPPPLAIGIVRLSASGLSSEPGSTARVALELREGDGTVALDGTLGLDPLAARQKLTVTRLDVERLLAATGATPARVVAQVDAALDVAAEQDPVTVAGTLAVRGVGVSLPESADFALSWRDLEAGIRRVALPGLLPGSPRVGAPRLELEHLRLYAPQATLTRTDDGLVLPTAAEPAADAPPAHAPAADAGAAEEPAAAGGEPPSVVVDDLQIEDGLVTFADTTVEPDYRGRVSSLSLRVRDLRYPEGTFAAADVRLRAPGGAPLTVSGARAARSGHVEAKIERLPLPQFNPYVKSAAGYSVARGAATLGTDVRWTAGSYRGDGRLTLGDLRVAGAEGDSLFLQRFGIPLTLALALLRDPSGAISLGIPVRGDRAGTRVDVASIAGEAIARALVNAIASPLKLIGAVRISGDRVDAIAPDPIGCIPGLPEIADDAWWRVEQLANFLPAVPALAITLRGMAGPADARALSEAAVLADLAGQSRALGALRNVASGGVRGAIRETLEARVRGAAAPPLEPDAQEQLDRWVAEKPIGDEALRDLAAKRAERLHALLTRDYGVAAERVLLGDPALDREGGTPQVLVALGAGS